MIVICRQSFETPQNVVVALTEPCRVESSWSRIGWLRLGRGQGLLSKGGQRTERSGCWRVIFGIHTNYVVFEGNVIKSPRNERMTWGLLHGCNKER